MLVFRSLALGLVGACLLLLAFRPAYEVRIMEPTRAARVEVPAASATLVDIGPGVSPPQLAELIHLAPGEHVLDVDDRPVGGDLDAGAALAIHSLTPGRYIDLTVGAPDHQRRVLVLVH